MNKIKKIIGRQIIDSRGNPTCEADVILENGIVGRGAVPSGASTGKLEALELRDNNDDNYDGKSVLKAISNINHEISYMCKFCSIGRRWLGIIPRPVAGSQQIINHRR